MQAVILSGGLGTRLHPLTLTTPKPMLPINGIPHLEYQVNLLKQHGIKDIIFSTGYLHEQIKDYFGHTPRETARKHGVIIRYKEDGEQLLGTAGALRNCLNLIDGEHVLVLNGDILTNIDLTEMIIRYKNSMSLLMMALTPVEDPTQFGVAKVKNGLILDFIEKPASDAHGNLINAGVYIIYKPVIEKHIEEGFSMIENTLFPKFATSAMLGAYTGNFMWIDIGTHARYAEAQELAKNIFEIHV